MASLLIHDSFESYYAGREPVIKVRSDLPVQMPKAARLTAAARERLLPVRLSDIKPLGAVKLS